MILINDKLEDKSAVHIDIEDRGYQFGDGVYEVVRIYNGKLFKMEEHLQRLQRSATEIQLTLPFTIDEIRKNLLKLVTKNEVKSGSIYMQVTRGVATRTHEFPEKQHPLLIAYTQQNKRPVQKIENGVRVITTEDIRWKRCDIKSLNLIGNVLAKQKAKDNASEEAILIRDNIVTEGSSTNVFIVKDGRIFTHPANNFILNGITRMLVIDLARENDIEVVEKSFSHDTLLDADEVFITGTLTEITPVIQIDQIKLSNIGEITKQLQYEFNAHIN